MSERGYIARTGGYLVHAEKREGRDTLPEARHEEHVTLNIETRHEGILRKVTKQTFSSRQEILNNT